MSKNPDKRRPIDNPGRFLSASVIATLALVAIASWLPGERLWGINHLAFYPTALRVVLLALAAALLLPPVGQRMYLLQVNIAERIRGRQTGLGFAILAISFAAVFGFLKLKASTWLLGDGQVIANQLAHLFSRPVSVPFLASKIIENDPIAPGTQMMYVLSALAVRPVMGEDPTNGIIVLNCVIGGAFVFLLLTVAFRSSLSATQTYWLIGLALMSGTVQLFFGYVENYGLVYFLGCVYAVLAIRALHGHSVWLPLVVLFVALASHIESVLFLPSYGFLLAWRFVRKGRERFLPRVAPTLVVVVAAAALVAAVLTPLRHFFLPLLPSDGAYSVLSLRHGVDIVNELLLLLPALPLIGAMGWILYTTPSQEEHRPAFRNDPTSSRKKMTWLSTREEWHFAMLLVVPCVVYLVFFNPEIGMARDWDLFSILNIGLVLVALLVLTRFQARVVNIAAARAPVAAMFFLGFVLVVSWTGINASPVRSTARFEQILTYDRTHASYAYENLARSYHEQNRLSEAIRAIENACAISHNPRQLVLLARYYEEYGDTENSIRVQKEAVNRRPEYELARRELCVSLLRRQRFAEAEVIARAGTAETPRISSFHYFLGKSLVGLGRYEEARDALVESKRLGLPEPIAANVDNLLEQLDRIDEPGSE
ncbi:MAG: hypothetical protein O7D32_09145 [bacterium]|nr:hypothetical protein [bacterium]